MLSIFKTYQNIDFENSKTIEWKGNEDEKEEKSDRQTNRQRRMKNAQFIQSGICKSKKNPTVNVFLRQTDIVHSANLLSDFDSLHILFYFRLFLVFFQFA